MRSLRSCTDAPAPRRCPLARRWICRVQRHFSSPKLLRRSGPLLSHPVPFILSIQTGQASGQAPGLLAGSRPGGPHSSRRHNIAQEPTTLPHDRTARNRTTSRLIRSSLHRSRHEEPRLALDARRQRVQFRCAAIEAFTIVTAVGRLEKRIPVGGGEDPLLVRLEHLLGRPHRV